MTICKISFIGVAALSRVQYLHRFVKIQNHSLQRFTAPPNTIGFSCILRAFDLKMKPFQIFNHEHSELKRMKTAKVDQGSNLNLVFCNDELFNQRTSNACALSPKLTPALRESIFARLLDANGEGVCDYCHKRVSRSVKLSHRRRATLDHVVPKAKGGANIIENFVISCRPCNDRKGQLSPERFRQVLKRLLR